MFKTLKYAPATMALALIICSTSFAQAPTSTSTTQKPETEGVTHTSFKNKVFEIKYRDPSSLTSVLYNLGSGFKGFSVSANAEFRTITVRDFPENIALMEEAIKRLDTPQTPRPNIELNMHVLIASNTGGTSGDVPADLKDVLTQLRATLNYRNYELVASVVQRLTETSDGLQGSGVAEIPALNPGTPNSPTPYEYYIRKVSLVQNTAGAPSVQINEFTFKTVGVPVPRAGQIEPGDNARVQTALNLRDGEKVVVGTATLRSRALVIVLIAKLVK